ncbi:MAG TPA: UDP-N-acetylglucosamine 2-epimerase (hydrolyzing) [Gammaproteobacteria bacterium]|nr:UDP-N-acetylglucosamine 2-epimerase (hydrolyzing) [Gammaproteobacteria bacterium]
MKRRICAVTGSRADYGLLAWTLREMLADPALELQLAVTGTHLSPDFGNTVRQIEADGIPIATRIDMQLTDDSGCAIGQALGRAVSGFAEALQQLQPDLLLVLGDRYEILAAAQAAMLQRIPIAHIHGGESTEGLIDEAVRHAVTKMAHIHCVAAEAYARRVMQMGEQPHTVHVVGAAGFDALTHTPLLDRASLEQAIDFPLGEKNFLLTLHPETLSPSDAAQQVTPLLEALQAFPEARVIITGSNADPAGRAISTLLQQHAVAHPAQFCYHESLGQARYLSLLAQVDLVIGNSSSGIIEAPAMGRAVVNIGERQRRRLRAPAIIDCASETAAIRAAIAQALTPEHQQRAAEKHTPYGKPGAAQRIVRLLRDTPLDGILQKTFFDLPMASLPAGEAT